MSLPLDVPRPEVLTAPSAAKGSLPRPDAPALPPGRLPEAWLPFTVQRVRNEDDLQAAVSVRRHAYERHVPAFASTLGEPEQADRASGSTVLLARSKLDGTPLGSMRIQTNRLAPLALEQSVTLPRDLAQAPLAEATRLGVGLGESGRLVTTALFKAMYLYCLAEGIEHMVIASRSPVDRQYRRLLFTDVFEPGFQVPLRHANNMLHHVLQLSVQGAFEIWRQAQHPLLAFMCATHHPDIGLPMPAPHAAPHAPAHTALH